MWNNRYLITFLCRYRNNILQFYFLTCLFFCRIFSRTLRSMLFSLAVFVLIIVQDRKGCPDCDPDLQECDLLVYDEPHPP